jgi:site-specific recombinase XerD
LLKHRRSQSEERFKYNLVFPNKAGNPMRESNMRQRFKRLLRKAGLPESLRLYDLRHGCATTMFQLGAHPKMVARLLGHANTKMTLDTY